MKPTTRESPVAEVKNAVNRRAPTEDKSSQEGMEMGLALNTKASVLLLASAAHCSRNMVLPRSASAASHSPIAGNFMPKGSCICYLTALLVLPPLSQPSGSSYVCPWLGFCFIEFILANLRFNFRAIAYQRCSSPPPYISTEPVLLDPDIAIFRLGPSRVNRNTSSLAAASSTRRFAAIRPSVRLALDHWASLHTLHGPAFEPRQ